MGPSSTRNTRASIVYVAVYRAASIGDFRHILSCTVLYCPVWRHLEAREQCPTKPTYLPAFVLHDLPTTHLDDCHRDTHTVLPYGGIDAIVVQELYRHKVPDRLLMPKL